MRGVLPKRVDQLEGVLDNEPGRAAFGMDGWTFSFNDASVIATGMDLRALLSGDAVMASGRDDLTDLNAGLKYDTY
ncbi:MAG: hypothetical protein ACYTF1_19270 [Planctomycetota bacterium]